MMESTTESPPESVDLPAHPPEDSPGGREITFRPDIEGLRAVAVVPVVLFHAGVSWIPGGFVGVDVFFVISGFLITSLLLREHEERSRISISGFYARRARRILPAAMLVIVLTVLASYFIQNFVQYAKAAQDGRWAALFAANIHFAHVGNGYFQQSVAPSPLEHYWSLGVEEQFYLVWPALIVAVGALFTRVPLRWRVTVLAAVATAASFSWSLVQTTASPDWAYFSPLTRGWELGVGALAAALLPQLTRVPRAVGVAVAYGGLAAIVVSALVFTSATPYPGTAALVPVLGAAAVIAGGASGVGAGHLLGLRPARSVGRVSFGWYLLHYPPMIILTGALWTHPLSVEENLIIGAVTLIVAYGMYAWMETPIRRSPFLAYRRWLSIALGGVLVGGAFLFCLLLHPSIHTLWQV